MRNIAIALIAAAASHAGRISAVVATDPRSVTLEDSGGWTCVSAPGAEQWAPPGLPRLPFVPVALVLPAGAGAATFSATLSGPVEIRLPSPVVPATLLRPLGSIPAGQVPVPDRSFYASEGVWPSGPLSATHDGSLCGFRIASCLVCPFEYEPSRGLLRLYSRVEVVLEWDDGPAPRLTGSQIEAASWRVERLVDNPLDVASSSPAVRPAGRQDAVWWGICDSSCTGELEPLRAFWEDSLGSAALLTVQEALEFPGADDPERLRNAIISLWEEHGAVYVLLAGDETLVPARFIHTECEGFVDYAPSDHYFSDLDGTWDASGDGVYGQPDDAPDLYMDVLLGRALVGGPDQTEDFADRTIDYMSAAPGGRWRKTALLCGAMLFPEIGYTGGRGCDTLSAALPASWDIVAVYEEPSSQDGSDTHIQYLDAGTNWNYYAAHGNSNGLWWSDEPYPMMTRSIALAMQNGDRRGFHTSIGCHPGAFQEWECCAEALFHSPGGAVSVTFNTSYGWEGFWPFLGVSEWLCILFTRSVFLEHAPTAGAAFASAKDQRVPLMHGGFDRNLQSILSWSAFQDPALEVLGVPPDAGIPPVPLTLGLPWPNPSTRGAPVTFMLDYTSGTAEVEAWDLAGRRLWSHTAEGPGVVQWDGCMSGGGRVPAGVYFITARLGDDFASRRVTVLD